MEEDRGSPANGHKHKNTFGGGGGGGGIDGKKHEN